MNAIVERTAHELIVLTDAGDTKVIWDPGEPEEVAAARETFTRLKKKGYAAYRVTKKGDQGEVMREFDPEAEKLIMAPPMVGG